MVTITCTIFCIECVGKGAGQSRRSMTGCTIAAVSAGVPLIALTGLLDRGDSAVAGVLCLLHPPRRGLRLPKLPQAHCQQYIRLGLLQLWRVCQSRFENAQLRARAMLNQSSQAVKSACCGVPNDRDMAVKGPLAIAIARTAPVPSLPALTYIA